MDFDEASRAWRANKVAIGRGWFAYRCQYIHTNGRRCPKVVAAQKRVVLYRIRDDWVPVRERLSEEYCVRHAVRDIGSFKELSFPILEHHVY